MPVWRATIFFEDRRYSWSDTYHYADQGATYSTVLAAAKDLAQAHLNLMGRRDTLEASPRIPYIRVSDDMVLRDAYIDNTLAASWSNYPGNPPDPCDPWDVLEMRAQIANRLRRKIWYVSSIPAATYYDRDGIFGAKQGAWIDRFADWWPKLIKTWGLYFRDNSVGGVPANPIFPVTSMTQTGNHLELVGVPLPLGGQRIALLRGKYGVGSPVPRGTFYTIPSTTANAMIIVPGLLANVIYAGGATAQAVVYTLAPFTDVSFVKKTHHKRGVFPGLAHRGRHRIRS